MRIITGSARGTKLLTLEGEEVTRPTTERVKEALFSMIQFDLEGRRVLDLFAGSGQLGLEALSRGAASATFCDMSREACEIIKKNAQKTKLYERTRILNTDYKAVIRGCQGREKFDIVFLDPPYDSDLVEDALARLLRADILAEGAIVICESNREKPFAAKGFSERRFAKYSKSYITLLVREAEEDGSSQ